MGNDDPRMSGSGPDWELGWMETKNYILAAYEFETFVKAFPKSQKVDEAYFLMAHAYYMVSPNYSLDQTDTYEALDKLQEFINPSPL